MKDKSHRGEQGAFGSLSAADGKNGQTERSLFWNKKYLFLMAAQAVSNLGDWLYILALFVLIGFRWHATPLVISGMMLALTAPMAVLGPFTGVLADKWNRTTLMLVSNLVMAGLVAVIPWLPSKWMLFGVLVLVGIFESLFNPAEAGKLKEIVSDNHMKKAVSINSSITQLAKVVGPGLSGVIVATLGSASAFWLDSLSFIVSSLFLPFTGFQSQTDGLHNSSTAKNQSAADGITEEKPQEGAGKRFVAGLQHIRRVRMLFAGTLILTVALLLIQLTDAQIVTLIRLVPDASSGLLGLIMALSGGGALLGALLVNVIKWKSASGIMAVGVLGCGVGLGGSALLVAFAHATGHITAVWMATIIGTALLVGVCAAFIFVPFQTMAQRSTPSHLTGRVFGTIGSLTTAAALVGPALGGVIVSILGAIAGFLITSATLLMLGASIFVTRRWLEGTDASANSSITQ
ncbi:MFS transporter [Alicyclobacillus sp. SO9]|uniref:MFS transporter n=1 Tax=Alicyclobacillus sp. SO9 TaxID=2665646 RepID=UPI0018E71E7E|nr:MFS transporter [Alicyclobacillus sp. SO9]QQE78167.1 MFS transporter [Alicyclobacillus sp. SO9]